jgi:hypothetical protein
MKQFKRMYILILVITVYLLSMVTVARADLQPVNIDKSTHIATQPTPYSTVQVSWGYSWTENISGYYYQISVAPYTLTFNDTNDRHATKNKTVSDQVRMEDGYKYYFYIGAYAPKLPPEPGTPLIYGPITTYGPIIVDTKAPEFVTVNTDSPTTDNRSIELTIGSNEKIAKVNISEGGYGNGTSYDFQNKPAENVSCTYDLQTEGVHTLYIQAMDEAGLIAERDRKPDLVDQHTTKASPYVVTFTTADDLIMAQYTSVPTLSQWGVLFFLTILICIGIVATRRNVLPVKF